MRLCVYLFFFLVASTAQAEYRAFLLRIEKINDPSQSRELLSTLDPLQYPGYYQVALDERVLYVRTWMCHGRTNLKPICPDPNAATTEGEAPPAQ